MVVSLEHVEIRYGSTLAVADATARFPAGAVGLLGRNGAGKSSILKALLGLVRPSAGRLQILDFEPGADGAAIRRRVGYMSERDGYVADLNGFETVRLAARLSGAPPRDAARRSHEVLYLVGLGEQRYRAVAGYSTGMRQKVKLAAALAHDPELLFLDEPTNGLDPAGRIEMLEIIARLTRDLGKSVVLSSHILQDVEHVCEHVVLLDGGRVLESGPVAELTRQAELCYELEVDGTTGGGGDALAAALRARGAHDVEVLSDRHFVVAVAGTSGPRSIFAAVRAHGGVVRRLVERRRSLEQVFLGALAGSRTEVRA